MKGQLFELMMGYVIERRGYTTQLAWRIPDGGNALDVDVRGNLNTSAVIVECKGLREDMTVEPGDVRKHFTRRTKIAHQILRQSSAVKITRVEGIVVTTASFDAQTVADLAAGAFGTQTDITLTLWDRQRLINELRADGHTELIQIVNQFYSAPPKSQEPSAPTSGAGQPHLLPVVDA